MRRPRRSTIRLALTALALGAALPGAAEAGTYRVSICRYNTVDGTNKSWSQLSGAYNVRQADECPANGRLRVEATNGGRGDSVMGGFHISALQKTWFLRIDYHVSSRRSASSPGLVGVLRAGQQHLEVAPQNVERSGITLGNASNVQLTLVCGYSAGCRAPAPDDPAYVDLYGATVEVEDPVYPSIYDPRGTIGAQQTQRGVADLVFDASDTTGIRSAVLEVNGREFARADYPCDFSKMQPCASVSGGRLAFDTRSLSNGTYRARLTVQDAASNLATYQREITVDNPVPSEQESNRSGSSGAREPRDDGSGGGSGSGPNSGGSSAADPAVVRAGGIALWVRPGRVPNGRSVRFFGRAPVARALVLLQARVGRGWRTFRAANTDASGMFSTAYRFTRTRRTQRYDFRAVVPAQVGLPAVSGGSRVVSVLVTRR